MHGVGDKLEHLGRVVMSLAALTAEVLWGKIRSHRYRTGFQLQLPETGSRPF